MLNKILKLLLRMLLKRWKRLCTLKLLWKLLLKRNHLKLRKHPNLKKLRIKFRRKFRIRARVSKKLDRFQLALKNS